MTDEASLRLLAARAALPWERASEHWRPRPAAFASAEETKTREARLRRWRESIPAGSSSLFPLATWDDERLRPLLGEGEWHATTSLPAWVETWRAIVADATSCPPSSSGAVGSAVADESQRWTPFVVPFARVAERRLLTEGAARGLEIAPVVRVEFGRLVRARLAAIVGPILAFEWRVFSQASQAAPRWSGGSSTPPPTAAGFAADLWSEQRAWLERAHPVLLRLCCEQIGLLGKAWLDLFSRLSSDGPGLARRYNARRAPGTLVGCRGGLSDPHHGAQTAVELRFSGGLRIIYKPRSLAPEAGYFSLLDWLGARRMRPAHRCPVIWDRGTYGWMEWIDAAPCGNRAEVRRHFVRTGAQLAVLRMLGGADLHTENWIAAGEWPVPVDLEVLLRPAFPLASGEARNAFDDSVLGTGLLPLWQASGNRVTDISALGAPLDNREPGCPAHRASLDGVPLAAADYVEEIKRGFVGMQSALRRHRAELLQPGGPLARLRRIHSRHLARPTEIYRRLIGRLLHPSTLCDGAAFGLELARLARTPDGAGSRSGSDLSRLIAAEAAALARLDVPLLHARGRTLETGEGPPVKRFFPESGWTACRRRLEAITPRETRTQAALIGAAFSVSKLDRAMPAETKTASQNPPSPLAPATAENLLAAARALGQRLAASAIPCETGLTWIAPQLLPQAGRFQLVPLAPTLFDGTAGPGLFFAALHRATGEARWALFADQVFAPLAKALANPSDRHRLARLPAGVGLGRGGLVYSLTKAGHWLGRPAWTRPDLAGFLSPLPSDHGWDVLSGAAGALLASLSLAAETNRSRQLDVARAWGDRLVAAQEPMLTGGRAWPDGGTALAGFAHGAAGAALALAKLGSATSEGRYLDAAHEAVAYERTLFDETKGNWRDLRERGSSDSGGGAAAPRFACAWCHGAPGILLARLHGILSLDTHLARTDIDAALNTVLTAPTAELDTACCGEAGFVDALLSASVILEQPELLAAARSRAAGLVAKAARGEFNAFGPSSIPAGPGFFQGLSGIGYTLLRAALPDRFPSVQAFE